MSLIRIIDRKWTSVIVNCLPMMAVFMELNPSGVDFTVWRHFLCLKDTRWQCVAFSLVLLFSFVVLGQSIWRTLHNKLYEIVIGTFSDVSYKWMSHQLLFAGPTNSVNFNNWIFCFVLCIHNYAHIHMYTNICIFNFYK